MSPFIHGSNYILHFKTKVGNVEKNMSQANNNVFARFLFVCDTVEPLLYDHPQNHIGVVVYKRDGSSDSLVRDSYTNRNHCPSQEMWSYERDGRW